MWRLRARGLPAEDPWAYMERIAEHRHVSVTDLYAQSKLSEEELGSSPLLNESTE